MKKVQNTRIAIVDSALNQAVKIGLEGVSIGSIASAVGMSKSGLFAHFKSKEGLQLAVVEEANSRFLNEVFMPAQKKPKGLTRLKAYYQNYIGWIAGKRGVSACPFITFVQEYDDRPGAIHDLLVESQQNWRDTLAFAARDAIKNNEISDAISPEQISFELTGAALSFQVSIGLLKSKKSQTYALKAFDNIVQQKI